MFSVLFLFGGKVYFGFDFHVIYEKSSTLIELLFLSWLERRNLRALIIEICI